MSCASSCQDEAEWEVTKTQQEPSRTRRTTQVKQNEENETLILSDKNFTPTHAGLASLTSDKKGIYRQLVTRNI